MVVCPHDPVPSPPGRRILLLSLAALLLGAPGPLPPSPPVIVAAAQLQPGRNSGTEWRARQRLAALRLNSVRFLRKDAQGFWRGLAWHAGQEVEVAMDAGGRVAIGPEAAARDGVVAPRNVFLYTPGASGRTASVGRGEGANLSAISPKPLNQREIHQN